MESFINIEWRGSVDLNRDEWLELNVAGFKRAFEMMAQGYFSGELVECLVVGGREIVVYGWWDYCFDSS